MRQDEVRRITRKGERFAAAAVLADKIAILREEAMREVMRAAIARLNDTNAKGKNNASQVSN